MVLPLLFVLACGPGPDTDTDPAGLPSGTTADTSTPLREPGPVRWLGPPLPISSSAPKQGHATVAVLPSGRWLVAYQSFTGVHTSLWDDGRQIVPDTTLASGYQRWYPQVIALDDGFGVSIVRKTEATFLRSDADGNVLSIDPIGQGEFTLAWPDLARLDGGRVLVSVTDVDLDLYTMHTHFWQGIRNFSPSASLHHGELIGPTAVDAANGHGVMTWVQQLSREQRTVMAQRFDGQGEPVGSAISVGDGQIRPTVAVGSSGDFVLAWSNPDGSCARRHYTMDGVPYGPVIPIPAVGYCRQLDAVAAGEDAWIAWNGDDGVSEGGLMRVSLDGEEQGAPLPLGVLHWRPALAIRTLDDGNVWGVITWEQGRDDATNVFARRFTTVP